MCGPWLSGWGFWGIFPLIGLLLCLGIFLVAFRCAGTGHRFGCMGHVRGAARR